MNFVIIFGYTVIYSTFQVIWFTFSEPIHNDHSRFGPCVFKLFCNILVDLWCCSLIFYIDWCRTKWVLTFKGSPKLLNSIWMLLVRSFTNKSLDVCHLSLRITSGLSIFHWFFFSRCTEPARACRRQDERQGMLVYVKLKCMNLGGGCLLAIVAASIQAGRREAGVAWAIGRSLGINPTPLYSLFFP